MARWRSLESVPKDRTDVLLWCPQEDAKPFGLGTVVIGEYVAGLDCYLDDSGYDIQPICWRPLPSGPESPGDIDFERNDE